MLRNLIITGCMLLAFAALAGKKQKKQKTPVPATIQQTSGMNMDYRNIGSPMPEVELVTLNKERIKSKDLKYDANLILMMFNPNCEHCEIQTDAFRSNIALFKDTRLVLMAGAVMLPYLEDFNRVHRIFDYPGRITMGVDSSGFIDKAFLFQGLPQINIYDKDRRLIKTFIGDVAIDSLKQYIQ